ncbi:hypothetical protein [Deinococcus multiflagellatus]|uniref:Uncharacterized protein n=1 Tax=Deinococcus multiflagellatus TaxID=1656887 RepID=A0ABW1ZER1_9DEIO|nr:hypothetical protein [Deinococcus multiflagellatus]MBZ9712199.1 hypothetical protein [Deinococcus multiflagellatus]
MLDRLMPVSGIAVDYARRELDRTALSDGISPKAYITAFRVIEPPSAPFPKRAALSPAARKKQARKARKAARKRQRV